MTQYQLSPYERESIVTMNDEDLFVTIYTCQRATMTKLDKLCKNNPNTYKLINEDAYSKTYKCPKKLISFRTPKAKRILTDEQRKIMSDRMKNLKKKS